MCILVLHAPGASTGTVTGHLEVGLAHCPRLAGRRFPLPWRSGPPVLVRPGPAFPYLWAVGLGQGGEQGQQALISWGWDAARPSPGFKNWSLSQTAGSGEKVAVQGSVPPSLYSSGGSPRSDLGPAWRGLGGQAQGTCLLVPSPLFLFTLSSWVCLCVLLPAHLSISTSAPSCPSSPLPDVAYQKNVGCNVRQAWIQILLLPLTGSVILGKSLSLSDPVSSSVKYPPPGPTQG